MQNIVRTVDIQKIEKLFDFVKEVDNGYLWSIPLHTPVLFVEPITKMMVANQLDLENLLVKQGNVYVGNYPEDLPIANSTTELGGKTWAMVIYSDEIDDIGFKQIMIHEMFHHKQPELGLDVTEGEGYTKNHMDDLEARISLKLEWNALQQALFSSNEEQRKAVKDALVFRYYRQYKYGSKRQESLFENHEGLPEYTAIKLLYPDLNQQQRLMKESLQKMIDEEKTPSLVRSFAYHSGPIYGLLLDQSSLDWRNGYTIEKDLGMLLQQAFDLGDIPITTYAILKNTYGFKEINQYEQERKRKINEQKLRYQKQFIEGPVLKIPLGKYNISFDPRLLHPLDSMGTVYGDVQIMFESGVLEVKGDNVLLVDDNNEAIVSAENIEINGKYIRGIHWSLELNDGFSVREKEEDFVIESQK